MATGKLVQRTNRKSTPRSLIRLMGLLEFLARSPNDGLDLTELARVLDTPKSSLRNLLRPLVTFGYIDCRSQRYHLGPGMLKFSSTIMSAWNFPSTARPFLRELADRSRESAYLGMLDRVARVITFVDAIISSHSVRYCVPVGNVRPLHCTAAGRVLLAFMDAGWQEEYIVGTKRGAHAADVRAGKGLRGELRQIRNVGVSVGIGDVCSDATEISAPVFDAHGAILAAITVGGPTARLRPRISELSLIAVDVAKRASGVFGELSRETQIGSR